MAKYEAKILIADDEEEIVDVLRDMLEALHYEVIVAVDGFQALALIREEEPVVVLLDLKLPKLDGLEVLRRLAELAVETTVIMLTAYGTVENAVRAMKIGAYDFIIKPYNPEQLQLVIEKAVERDRLRRQNTFLNELVNTRYSLLIGGNRAFRDALDEARVSAETDTNILLVGETGTGKEIFARAIHRWSRRAREAFVPINCAALSEELLLSELFGHEKGAFTSAHQRKLGKLEIAHKGTVFLDEIGDIDLSIQAKLLRFLQEYEFERLGGNKQIKVDIRVIAATNKDLRQAIKNGTFRDDLYFRLNVVSIMLPPLRKRLDDIRLLADYFLQNCNYSMKKSVKGITDEAFEVLQNYTWPGNVRELQNVIERAVVFCRSDGIHPQDILLQPLDGQILAGSTTTAYHDCVREFKRRLIYEVLQQSSGSPTKAARTLKLRRTYLARLIKQFDVKLTPAGSSDRHV
ncbi:MAG: sigma-54-dependent Fis family transcriptional regulator [Candidatus Tectomicrobia bacterium]|nr:sigma-54-dependent Fis family transcriptional regulator [Candidatus Tectomicrobia bacterium]